VQEQRGERVDDLFVGGRRSVWSGGQHRGPLYRAEAMPSAIIAGATSLNRTTVQHRLAPVPTWHNGRMVLVGDAAHPVGGGRDIKTAGVVRRKAEELVMPIVFRHFLERMTSWLYDYQPPAPAPEPTKVAV